MAGRWGSAVDRYVMFFAIKAIRGHPYIVVGLFWYLGTLVPVIGLLQVGGQAMADRYTYPINRDFCCYCMGNFRYFKKVALSKNLFWHIRSNNTYSFDLEHILKSEKWYHTV